MCSYPRPNLSGRFCPHSNLLYSYLRLKSEQAPLILVWFHHTYIPDLVRFSFILVQARTQPHHRQSRLATRFYRVQSPLHPITNSATVQPSTSRPVPKVRFRSSKCRTDTRDPSTGHCSLVRPRHWQHPPSSPDDQRHTSCPAETYSCERDKLVQPQGIDPGKKAS